jgi:hypothetical protein
LFSELERERRQARFAIMPLVLAEGDAEEVVRRRMRVEAEGRAMEGVPGWVVGQSPYKTDTQATRRAVPLH